MEEEEAHPALPQWEGDEEGERGRREGKECFTCLSDPCHQVKCLLQLSVAGTVPHPSPLTPHLITHNDGQSGNHTPSWLAGPSLCVVATTMYTL